MQFNDVKSKDFIELAGVPAHLQGAVVAEHRVKWRLREALEAKGITHPYDQIFFSATADGVVNFSKSLVAVLVEAVLDGNSVPVQFGSGGGFYAGEYDTREEVRLDLPLDDINDALLTVYTHIKETEAQGA